MNMANKKGPKISILSLKVLYNTLIVGACTLCISYSSSALIIKKYPSV